MRVPRAAGLPIHVLLRAQRHVREAQRARRSAFWQFVHSNHAPLIRVGRKKIMFSERAVRDWLAPPQSFDGQGLIRPLRAIGMAALGLSGWQFCSLSVPCFTALSENDAP
jgi:hypothetical protein